LLKFLRIKLELEKNLPGLLFDEINEEVINIIINDFINYLIYCLIYYFINHFIDDFINDFIIFQLIHAMGLGIKAIIGTKALQKFSILVNDNESIR